MPNKKIKIRLDDIFKKLSIDLSQWVSDLSQLLEKSPGRKLTASLSWEFINKQIKNKIEKWYILVQDAIDSTEEILVENEINQITPEIEQHIRNVFEPKLEEYQTIGKEFVSKYQNISSNIDSKIWIELTDIVFEITIENILNILKEVFDDR